MAKAAKTEKATGGVSAAFRKKLKGANAAWKKAKKRAEEASVGEEFKDGKYMARLVKASIGESQASNRLQAAFGFKLQEGPQEGQIKYAYDGLETDQNLEYFAKRIGQLGYEVPDDLGDVADILADITESKPLCKIRIKTNGDFQNVYIDKVYDEDEEPDEDEEDGDTDDEDAEESDAEESDDAEEEEEEEEPEPKKKTAKTAKTTSAKKKKAPVEEDEESDEEESDDEESDESEEEEPEQVQLTKGLDVVVATTKGDRPAKVVEVLEDEGKVRVKFTDGKEPTALRVGLDKLSVAEEDETEDEEEEDVPEEPVRKKKPAKK